MFLMTYLIQTLTKYLAIIIDDFSSRSQNYDNVVIYDYADYFITTNQDQYFKNVDQYSPSYLNELITVIMIVLVQ